MFSNASNFIINQGNFVDNGRDALQFLSQYVAQGATHGSYAQDDAPKCHPDTRKRLLRDIKQWMIEPDKETSILYLHGPAGAGKSCIARSTCVQSYPPGFLLASFFFWRGSDERNNITKLFTTIAYQLAMLNVDLAGFISDSIQRNPRIVSDASARSQFRKLILEPCRRLADRSGGQLNGAIIIDGLDECFDKEAQILVIELLAMMVNRKGFPLGFFVTSRPELHLKEVWDTEDIAPVTNFISLSDIPNASDDIRTVLQSGFSRILNDRRFKLALQSVSRPWPYWSDVETLVERSPGQFIYAATVLKFVSNRSRNPDAQLQTILMLPACGNDASPLADLDSLYRGILSRADDPARTINVLSFILAIMDVRHRSYDISGNLVQAICDDLDRQLLVIEQLIPLPPGEAFLALNDLHALIDLRDRSQSISFYHKSFHDFLLTSNRSKEFYIDIEVAHAKIIQLCVKFLCLPKYNTPEQHVGWLYSFFVWPIHICASGRTLADKIHNFEQPVQRFSGTQLHISHVHLINAFKILGLGSRQFPSTEVAEVITGFCRLSASTFAIIREVLWTYRDTIIENELSRFKEISIFNPLLVAHIKSYQMNLLTVKRSLAIHAIVPFKALSESGMYSAGIINDLASLPEIQKNTIYPDLFHHSRGLCFRKFLSSPQFSGIFSCTPEDFADAYCDIINITTVPSEVQVDQYSNLLQTWTSMLHKIKPAAAPAFLATLKSAARNAHDQSGLNRSLTHQAEVDLLKWLENLPSPPQDIIDAWKKAFDKARRATLEHRVGYKRYFCWYLCPTKTCPQAA